jgi:hypothetical protein
MYSMKLTAEQHEYASTLKALLNIDVVQGEYTDLDEVDFEDDAIHDDSDPLDDDSPVEPHAPADPVPTSAVQDPIKENEIQSAIFNLTCSLFTQKQGPNEDKFYSPVIRYLILSSVRSGAAWIKASQIRQTQSALLCAGRLTVFYRLFAYAQEKNETVVE